MKKTIILLPLLGAFMLTGCGESSGGQDVPSDTTPTTTTTITTPTTESTTSSDDNFNYGKASFPAIKVFSDGLDGVKIRPVFTGADEGVEERAEFSYEIEDEEIAYLEDDVVYYAGNGTTRIIVTSPHYKQIKFYVTASSAMFNSNAMNLARTFSNKAPTAAEDTTLFVGDSYFEFWRNGTNGVKTTAQTFPGKNITNYGISGTQASEWIAMTNNIIAPINNLRNVIINIGVNDVDDANLNGAMAAIYIQNFIKSIKECQPDANIYYFSLIRSYGYFASKFPDYTDCNNLMKPWCESQDKVTYLDAQAEMTTDCQEYKVSDGLHLNQLGYDVYTELINEYVDISDL